MKSVLGKRFIGFCALLAAVSVLGGCATTGNPKDPIEGFNRAVFALNEGVDKAVLKPLAKGYDAVVPVPAKTGVSNFFGNIADVFIGVNDLLQGKARDAASDAGRVLVNSTIGILGFIDFATDFGLEKHEEDFGQTFGHWGAGPGAYLVVPFWGPRDVRDAAGLALDVYADPVGNIHNVPVRNSLLATRIISDRTALLPAEKVIEEAALDKYSYIRDAYLQRRRSLIYDGVPPREDFDSALPMDTRFTRNQSIAGDVYAISRTEE
ncbi:ABC transporter [Georgfuchsia toluolica]|uniref:ABC transporter n=1 Tax=Georgfuchsia toluolica TaxID=424218 RepID=A0A916J6T6_9PROT|nr:ABC transporter [Georgfuchsia toluolica]